MQARPKKGGPGKNPVPTNGKKFSKTYQPGSEAVKAGIWRKKRGMELAKAILELNFKGAENSDLLRRASDYFKIPQKDITVEMMLLFRQAEKAIQKADTQAFNAVMDRTFGKPKEKHEVGGVDGAPIALDHTVKHITHNVNFKNCEQAKPK